MSEILQGLTLLFVFLIWFEHSDWILDQRRRMPKRKASIRRRFKNWRRGLGDRRK